MIDTVTPPCMLYSVGRAWLHINTYSPAREASGAAARVAIEFINSMNLENGDEVNWNV